MWKVDKILWRAHASCSAENFADRKGPIYRLGCQFQIDHVPLPMHKAPHPIKPKSPLLNTTSKVPHPCTQPKILFPILAPSSSSVKPIYLLQLNSLFFSYHHHSLSTHCHRINLPQNSIPVI